MKILIHIILLSGIFLACKSESETKRSPYHDLIHNPATADLNNFDTVNIAKIRMIDNVYDFGELNEGDTIVHKFKFQNVGKRDLFILDSRSVCGCTIAEFSEEAIEPGRYGEITVQFDTHRKTKEQEKKLTIFTNTLDNKQYVTLKGYVYPKK